MPSQIIAGVDGADGGRDAVALATTLADASAGAELTVAVVYLAGPIGGRGLPEGYDALLREQADKQLESARAACGSRERTSFVVVRGTSPTDGLHRLAEERHADCIVVGSSHLGRLGRMVAGSVTEQTLHGAPCAVAVAPAGYAAEPRSIATIGVAYDTSQQSRHALGIAADLARKHGAALRIVRVLDEQIIWYGGYAGAEALADIRRFAEQELREAGATVEGVDDVEGILLEGRVSLELARTGEQLDLLVVGSRGHGPLRRVLLGSVSAQIVRDARCPLLVVPHTAEEEQPPAE